MLALLLVLVLVLVLLLFLFSADGCQRKRAREEERGREGEGERMCAGGWEAAAADLRAMAPQKDRILGSFVRRGKAGQVRLGSSDRLM